MELLPVSPPLYRLHHQIFRGDEGQVLLYRFLNHSFIDMEPVCYILGQTQDSVSAQEALGQGNAPVG